MKKQIIITMLLFVGMVTLQAQSIKQPIPVFGKTVHDFGKINESAGNASCVFTFTNKGSAPLLLQSVTASCGCTTPEYTKEPVLPGKQGSIKVIYAAAGRPGVFNKEITIHTNVPDTTYKLTIKGEVIPEVIRKKP